MLITCFNNDLRKNKRVKTYLRDTDTDQEIKKKKCSFTFDYNVPFFFEST